MRLLSLWLVASVPLLAASARADTLFLKVGKTLKIESLACEEKVCVAEVSGGQVEVRASDVLRVEPDEVVDPALPEPLAPAGLNGPGESGPLDLDIEAMVETAARRYALPPSLVRAVAHAESAFDPGALSPRGAQGLMQLMPATARELGVRDAFDPSQNIDAGARLLRRLLERYEGRVAEALAAYNAGPGAVARHGGVPPYRETRGYIRRVVREFEAGRRPIEKGQ